MGDIAQRGNRLTFAKGGRAGFQDGKKVQRRGKHIPGKWNPERKTDDRPTEGTKLILHKGTKPYTPEGA